MLRASSPSAASISKMWLSPSKVITSIVKMLRTLSEEKELKFEEENTAVMIFSF